jgi:REP element-mobilizing transposase RayT
MPLFRDDDDRWMFVELLAEQIELSRWTLLEYSLMTSHYHLVLQIEDELSSGFLRLQSLYARRYNRRHSRRGVVWMKRFWDEMVLSESHLFESIRYVARNAVRAGICERAEDYPWCSYGAAIGVQAPDPIVDEDALLELFSPSTTKARNRLRAYVEEPDPRVRWRQTSVRRLSDAQK